MSGGGWETNVPKSRKKVKNKAFCFGGEKQGDNH